MIIKPYNSNLSQADSDRIRDIYARSIAANEGGFIQDLSFHGDILEQAETCQNEGGDFLIGYDAGTVIGFGALKPDKDGLLELCKLHVDADVQGQGYGRALSSALIERAPGLGAKGVSLHVTVTQVPAISLYESLGFERTGQKLYDVKLGADTKSFDTIFMKLIF